MRFYGCRSGYILVEDVCKLKSYSIYKGAQVHYGSSAVRKPSRHNGFNNVNRVPADEDRWNPRKGLHLKSMFRRWKKQARFNDRMAIRNLMDTYYYEQSMCGECGYPLWICSNPYNFKRFICPKYEGNSIVDCWD